MNHPRRLASLFLPALLLVALLAPRGETQTAGNLDPRFAFADTTLLRDTLGLTFERLFPLADSLRLSPEALKQMSVRYRWSLARLVKMADSLDVPIDSVGPIMERERFNPLANVGVKDQMTYTSTYTPKASGDNWNNALDYSASRGRIFLVNHVDVDQNQKGRSGTLGRQETRNARTTLNWRFSPRFSLGTEVTLSRYDDVASGGISRQAERVNIFGFSMNARPQPVWGITPSFNVIASLDDIDRLSEEKRGPSGQVNATFRYTGLWLSHDLTLFGKSSSLRASTTDPDPADDLVFPTARARDNNSKVRGTLNMLRGRPVEMSVNYQIDNTRTQLPIAYPDSERVIQFDGVDFETTYVVTPLTNKSLSRVERGTLDGTLRIKPVEYANLDVTWRAGTNDNVNSTLVTSTRSGEDRSISAAGRVDLGRRGTLQSTFSVTDGITRYPKRDFPRGGYREESENRQLNTNATWAVMRGVSLALEAGISLQSARYSRIDSARTIPVANDVASQYYRLELRHTAWEPRLTNAIGLRVGRTQYVNLPAASTASNNNGRSYRATWSWSYRIFNGLTANQTNTVSADYAAYPFAAASNRLSLDYSTNTTLSADVLPRLHIDVFHTARYQPNGNYRPQVPNDPTEYFSRSDQSENYSIRSTLTYSPIPAFSLNVTPDYSSNSRDVSQNGVLGPQRRSRSLKISGGATVNLPVGARGRLSGNVSRTLNSDRVINYTTSGPDVRPRNENSYLNGNMTFTWTL